METQAAAVVAFGPEASAYARRLPLHWHGIVADASDCARALAHAVALRRAGVPFFVMPLIDDRRSLVAMQFSHVLLHQFTGDSLRQHFDALANQQLTVNDTTPQHAVATITAPVHETLSDFVLTGNVLVGRSRADVHRLRSELRESRAIVAVHAAPDPDVPNLVSDRSGPVVVWAPKLHASMLGVILFGLQTEFREIVVVCAGGSLPQVNARFTNDPSVLSTASLIVDATVSDPGVALALARVGVPMACASTTGIDEYFHHVPLYDPWSWRSVAEAVAIARGTTLPEPIERNDEAGYERAMKAARAPQLAADRQPRVTIIVPTYNRREKLKNCLAMLESQQYENFDILVVNDAGENVADIVSEHSRATLIEREVNGGPMHAQNTGIQRATGEYIAFVADDDLLYPDFLARMIAAAEQSRAPITHSNTIMRFTKQDGDADEHITVGYKYLAFRAMDRFEVHWGGCVSMTGMIVHRSVFERHGALDPENAAADYEFLVRTGTKLNFAHCDETLAEFTYAMDGKGFSHRVGIERILRDYQTIFARYPVPGSAVVERNRLATLAWLKEKNSSYYWEPPIYLTGGAT